MSMDKYGVSDREDLQRKELAKVRAKLGKLRRTDEKTASVTDELHRLQLRESELVASLAEQ